MKSKIGLLMKIQLLHLLNPASFKSNSNLRNKRKILLTALGVAVVSAVMMSYSALLAYGYAKIGMAFVIPRMMTGTCALALVFFTFLRSSGALFGSKDFDMVMSLPVEVWKVVAVKFSGLYFIGLFAHIVLLAPSFVVYGIYTGVGAGEILSMLFLILIAPVLPVLAALALGTLIMVITSRLPYRQFFSLVLCGVGTVAIVVWSMGMGNKEPEYLADIGELISGMIGRIYPPCVWAVSLLEGRGIAGMAGFTVVSLAAAVLLVAVVARFYLPVNSAIASLRRRQGKKARSSQAVSPFGALLRKEFKRLTSCTIYAMNTTVGLLLLLAAGVAVLFVDRPTLERALGFPGMGGLLDGMLPLFVAFLAALSPTTAPSLSLEGKNRWIMCSIPAEPVKILQAKIALNLILAIPCVLFCQSCLYFKFRPQGIHAVLLFVVPVCYTLFSAVFGMFSNVKFPNYDWTHEQQAVKNSASVLMSIFGSMLLCAAPLMLSIWQSRYAVVFSLAGAALALLIAAVCYGRLRKTVFYM